MPNKDVGENTWKILWKSYIFFVPTFAIFITESATSLQIWRATQMALTDVSTVNEKRATHLRRQTRLALLVKLSVLMVLAMKSMWLPHLPEYRSERGADLQNSMLSIDIDFLSSVYLIGNMFCTTIGSTTRTIYRSADDKLELALTSREGHNELIIMLVYVAVAVFVMGTYIQDLGALSAVLHASVLHFYIVNVLQRFTTRNCMKPGFTIAVTCLGIRILFSPNRNLISYLTRSEEAMQIDWLSVLISGVSSATPYGFVASCYRYDFANDRQVKSSDANDGLFIPSRTLNSDSGHMRVLDPEKRFRPSFQKPYFRAALAGWLFSYVIFAFLDARWGTPSEPSAIAMGFGVACLTPICMRLSVFALSIIRGERERFWNYREGSGDSRRGVYNRGVTPC